MTGVGRLLSVAPRQNIPFEWPVSDKAAGPDLFSVYAGY